ncbi:TSC22 domain family protein 1 isoform X2 [Elgaria multicarinata webbii]|uniref:TSC22 domain family protein 1 isoform X2 n=1 Tax=Elgaria multicarinata webbii TaxID=159646 RepID=UPI002FCCBF07
MHQPESAADTGARKMAHPAMLPRRGSSSSSGNVVPALGTAGSTSSGSEDYPPPLLIQPPPAAAASSSSSPGPPPPPPPPQSLTLLSQPPQPLSQAGAQMKKKSGFQITSVTPAQISASLSSNNSIAEDTESYDDLDESHTEDLSSSEILDVSLSRATDLGEPERSSSEETLNNFQEAESPGAVSPNQPRLPHQQQQQPPPSLPYPPQQQSVVINGSIHPLHGHHYHHHHHHHHGHHHASHAGVGGPTAPGGPPSSPSFRRLSTAGSTDSVPTAAMPVSAASSAGSPAATTVSHFRPPGTPGVPSASGATTSMLSSVGSASPSVVSSMPGHVNKNLSHITSTGTSGGVNVAVLSGVGNGLSASSSAVSNASNPVAASAASSHLQPAASTSRFRVVKLDSSSEPFKKGRWTCTEFYDKETPGSVTEGVAVNKAVDTLKQNPLEVTSERESTSGSSVSSNVSTLSHYTESVGSGEMGTPTVVQQQAFQGAGAQQVDFSSTAPQPVSAPSLPQSISQPQLAQVQLHAQDVNYPQQKQGVQAPASAVPLPVNIVGGHQQPVISTMVPPQLPYTQSTQPVPVVPQPQPLPYGQGQAQHQAPSQQMPMHMTPGHVKAVNQSSVAGPMPDYIQQQQMLQTPASMQTGPAVVGTGSAVGQAPSMQPSVQAHLAVASSQPVAHAQATMPTVGASAQMMKVGQPGNVPPVVQQPPVTNQIAPSVIAQSAAPSPSQVVPPVPAGIIHPGPQSSTSSLPQPLVIAPQSTLLPVQAAEPLVQGMAGQQLPPVSPVPSVSAVSVPGHSAANVISTPMSLAPSKNVAQSSGVQNGNLVQNVSPASLISTSINLPAAQNVPQQILQNSTQFSALSLAQSISARGEDGRRSTEPTLVGLHQPTSSESGAGASGTISDVGSSMASSLFPLKVLPLTVQLVDGEDESSSGASVVAIDNKIEQAMDLVKSHLMYAVREEVEVLKEQIKELIEKNNQLEQENNLLKTLASPEQLAQFQAQLQTSPSPPSSQPQGTTQQPPQPAPQGSGPSA